MFRILNVKNWKKNGTILAQNYSLPKNGRTKAKHARKSEPTMHEKSFDGQLQD